MNQQRDPDCERKKQNLATDEIHQVPTFGARMSISAEPADGKVTEVIEKVPFNCHKAVQRPQVYMLPAVKAESFLVRRKPSEDADLDIVIMSRDVGIGVMDDVVFTRPTK